MLVLRTCHCILEFELSRIVEGHPHLETAPSMDLVMYQQWLKRNGYEGTTEWLFPSTTRPQKHIDERQFYNVMAKVGDLLDINYLGTHTMRKTGAYRVYVQSNYNIGLVMKLLNHSSEAMTLAYLELDQVSREYMRKHTITNRI